MSARNLGCHTNSNARVAAEKFRRVPQPLTWNFCPVLRCWKGGVFVRVILTWVWKLKPKAAVQREDDAMALAQALQQKKFPAFVITPCTDKYYRVHVGPYECV